MTRKEKEDAAKAERAAIKEEKSAKAAKLSQKAQAIEDLKWLDRIAAPVKMDRAEQTRTVTAFKSLEAFVLGYPE